MKRQGPRQAQLDPSGRTPAHQLGMIEITGGYYRLLPLGAWNSTASYVPGNLVTSGGTTYLCIAANTNETPPNATYWETFTDTDYFLRSDRIWAKPSPSASGPGLLDTLLGKSPNALWKLDESSGTVAHDSSGSGYDQSVPPGYSAPTWGDTAGPPGEQCALFTAASLQRFALGGYPDLALGGGGDFTVLGWFKPVSGLGEGTLIGSGGTPGRSGGRGWQLNGRQGFQFTLFLGNSGGGLSVVGDNALVAGDWYMGAFAQSAGHQYLYVNGLQQTTVGNYTYSPNAGIFIGNDGDSPPDDVEACDGDMSYWATFNRALSGAEILAIYNSGFPNEPDGSVYSADGSGGTTWREATGVAPATVSVTADAIEIGVATDGATIDTDGSGQLEIKAGGVDTVELADAGPGATGPVGDSTHTPVITIDAKGRVTGLSSAAISGIGGSAVTLLNAVSLASDGTFDVSGIDQTYSDLLLVLIARATTSAALDGLLLRLNNDSTSGHYIWQNYRANGSTVSAATGTASQTSEAIGALAGATAPTGYFGVVQIELLGYASTTWQKFAQGRSAAAGNATSINLWEHSGQWLSTAAINRVQLFGQTTANLLAGSQLRIYGRT